MSVKEKYDAIVIGAGVVGPNIAIALARQGRKVLIVERDWSKPDRIVGELLQPGGLKALKELGTVQAVNNIGAISVKGYHVMYKGQKVLLQYPEKSSASATNSVKPVMNSLNGGSDKMVTDDTLDMEEWDKDERVRGVAFHNGSFLQNLRHMAKEEPNIDTFEGTVVELLRSKEDPDLVEGVSVKVGKDQHQEFKAHLTICCDGIYSKFRKELSPKNIPSVGSYFAGLCLENAKLPAPCYGHVLLGDHAPVLIYQISPTHTRILCAYRSTKPPSQTNNELQDYLTNEVLPVLPDCTKPAFVEALKTQRLRVMPNQYLPALKQGQTQRGLILLGDSLNMRHPLTGGGMTVGLNDAVILAKLLSPKSVSDFSDHKLIAQRLAVFHRRRKSLDAVVNTLSIALYTLFAADKNSLKILQRGCFHYFRRGGDCVDGPIGLLSGMLPFPMILFNHFFCVAFYGIYCNFAERGLLGFPLALLEAIDTIVTAIIIFTPYLLKELVF